MEFDTSLKIYVAEKWSIFHTVLKYLYYWKEYPREFNWIWKYFAFQCSERVSNSYYTFNILYPVISNSLDTKIELYYLVLMVFHYKLCIKSHQDDVTEIFQKLYDITKGVYVISWIYYESIFDNIFSKYQWIIFSKGYFYFYSNNFL